MGLLDDIAALAKLAAASIDDVGAATGRATAKAAGVVAVSYTHLTLPTTERV